MERDTQISPGGSGAADARCDVDGEAGDVFPLHVHHPEDEGNYVLDGSLTAVVGEDGQRLL